MEKEVDKQMQKIDGNNLSNLLKFGLNYYFLTVNLKYLGNISYLWLYFSSLD